jgi:amino acid transporter
MANPHVQNPYAQHSPEIPFPATNNLQTGAPPPPYGQQYGVAPPEHPQGTLILIFGVLGIFFALFGAIAWYLGANARKKSKPPASDTPTSRISTLAEFSARSSRSLLSSASALHSCCGSCLLLFRGQAERPVMIHRLDRSAAPWERRR